MKAQELDDNLSEAHMSLGNTLVTCDWDWEKAEQELERAIELSPNSVLARDAYRLYLAYVGHFDEALDEINIILELEPLSPLYRRFPGWHYYLARRHEESILELQKLPEQRAPAGEPEWRAWPLVFLAMNYMALGRHEEALATCDKIKTLMPEGTLQYHDSVIARVYTQAGRRDEAQEILGDWTTRADGEQIEPVFMAIMYGALGYTDQALDWLTRGYENRSPIMLWLKVLPLFDPLRDDPRFQDILRRMNFPE
jgi:tetratricopeptide (TPR) repeat protein